MTTVVDQAELGNMVLAHPYIGLQTYEFFEGDPIQRAAAKAAFLAGTANPHIEYPKLDRADISQREQSLGQLFVTAQNAQGLGSDAREAYEGTIGYRRREAQFLLQATDLNQPQQTDDQFAENAQLYQQTNESLYGVYRPEIFAGLVNELEKMVGGVEYKGQAREIYDELAESFFGAHGDTTVAPLPTLSEDARGYLAEMVDKTFQPERQAVTRGRQALLAAGKDALEPDDIVAVMQDAIDSRGLDNLVKAFKAPGGALSWSQEDKGVRVGDKRSPIKTDDALFGVAVHELGWHGLKYVLGRMSNIAVMGNGLYTTFDTGEAPDYLTFEEGAASVLQNVAAKTDTPWTVVNFRGTLNNALAYVEKDFRGVFEVTWRLLALLEAKKSGGQLQEQAIEEVRSQAYDDVLRIFRGAPIDRTAELDFPVTYNKDLSYLLGKVSAVTLWNDNVGNDSMFYFLLTGKFDPTNKRQLAIAHTATGGTYV